MNIPIEEAVAAAAKNLGLDAAQTAELSKVLEKEAARLKEEKESDKEPRQKKEFVAVHFCNDEEIAKIVSESTIFVFEKEELDNPDFKKIFELVARDYKASKKSAKVPAESMPHLISLVKKKKFKEFGKVNLKTKELLHIHTVPVTLSYPTE